MRGYPAVAWLGLGYLAIFGTVLGFLWYYEGIQAIGATRASLFINFVPVSAVLMAFVILGEPLTFALLAGAALVTGGVFLTNRFTHQGQAHRPAGT
jgi:drug/metabolite transporter (DMT)-like permease